MNLRLTAALAAFVFLAAAAVAQAGHGCGCDQACDCESACDQACGCEECSGCDCLECCDWNCGPVWEFRASYLYLERDSDSVNIANDPGGMELLNGDDFQFDNESGVDLAGIYHYGCGRSIEARFVWIDDWQDTVNFQWAPGPNTYNTTPTTFFTGPGDAAASYLSEFQSGEINLRREVCCGMVVLFAGFRYIELNEDFNVFSEGLPGASFQFDDWRTQNDMYGFQLGAQALLWENCSGWRVQGSARAGVYYNDAESNYRTIFNDQLLTFANAEDEEVAFAGEAEVLAVYQLNCTWSAHAGYRVLLIDGAALAPNQVPATGNFNGLPPGFEVPAIVDLDGTIFAHGLVAGVGARW